MAITAKTAAGIEKSIQSKEIGLNPEEIDTLWRAYARTKAVELRNRLVEHYIGIPRRYAEHLKSRLPSNVDVNDLGAAGHLGLIEAVEKFNPERGVKFETFCVRRINGAMLDELRRLDWVPRTIRNMISRFMKAQESLTAQLGREPTEKEIAKAMGVKQSRFQVILREINTKAQISLDNQPSGYGEENESMFLSRLVDNREPSPVDIAARKEFVQKAMLGLNLAERTVLSRYYFEHATMKEIGSELNVSESRVCQIHAAMLNFLKTKFEGLEEMLF